MTREEAIKVIHKMLAYTDLNVRANLTADMVDACHIAIKALEQEPIFDKIRAEIESITPKAHIRTGKLSIDTELMIPLDRVLKVLDKYKSESEEI